MILGTVESCLRYPVKSFQGLEVSTITVQTSGVVGDRERAVIDLESQRVLSAKRAADMLMASASDSGFSIPGQGEMSFDDPSVDSVLSAWLGREVALRAIGQLESSAGDEPLAYEMTFDPTNDEAEYFQIPIPAGTFLDLAAVHLLTRRTLEGCAELRPDLNFDARRFRPNLILDVPGEAFLEDDWIGRRMRIGVNLLLEISQPTVRCAMPLRAQPELNSEPGLFHAMTELHPEFPNHLGAYANVLEAGVVSIGDEIELED